MNSAAYTWFVKFIFILWIKNKLYYTYFFLLQFQLWGSGPAGQSGHYINLLNLYLIYWCFVFVEERKSRRKMGKKLKWNPQSCNNFNDDDIRFIVGCSVHCLTLTHLSILPHPMVPRSCIAQSNAFLLQTDFFNLFAIVWLSGSKCGYIRVNCRATLAAVTDAKSWRLEENNNFFRFIKIFILINIFKSLFEFSNTIHVTDVQGCLE